MSQTISDHTPFTHPIASYLKLRLHQHQCFAPLRLQQGANRWKDECKGDKRHVCDSQCGEDVIRPIKLSCAQSTQVGALSKNNAFINAQTPGRLAIANVNAINPTGPVLQQTIGEATRRNSTIKAGAPLHRDRKCLQRCQQLFTPS